ncbi:hypothetical protein [Streptomyces sp. RM72]|uniref:hypothetical protein n=1 Tax=Streptomyces sp. RM72 TaxID=1115510 RepID=UPI0035A96A61
MASRFAVLTVRPAGKHSLAEWPEDQDAPTGYWISILAATTPVADLMRWAKACWQIEHYYRELKHGLGQDHFEGTAPGAAGTTTSPSSPPSRRSSPSGGSTQKPHTPACPSTRSSTSFRTF